MERVIDVAAIRTRYDAVSPNLDEKGLRLFAASEALAAGRGVLGPLAEARGTVWMGRGNPGRPVGAPP